MCPYYTLGTFLNPERNLAQASIEILQQHLLTTLL